MDLHRGIATEIGIEITLLTFDPLASQTSQSLTPTRPEALRHHGQRPRAGERELCEAYLRGWSSARSR